MSSKSSGKLWCFGDSFTYGDGCRSSYDYYEDSKYDNGELWSTIVSNHLNLVENNLGMSGNSNEFILQQIILNLSNFNREDILIISDTLPLRRVLYNNYLNEITTMTTDWELEVYSNDIPNPFYRDDKEKRTLVDYIYTFLLPYESEWYDYYLNQYNSIIDYLNNNGITTYFWSHEIWNKEHKFERIRKATNGTHDDGHFSWKGHIEFSKYLLDRISKKEYYPKPSLI